jgi:hypothetical protein
MVAARVPPNTIIIEGTSINALISPFIIIDQTIKNTPVIIPINVAISIKSLPFGRHDRKIRKPISGVYLNWSRSAGKTGRPVTTML